MFKGPALFVARVLILGLIAKSALENIAVNELSRSDLQDTLQTPFRVACTHIPATCNLKQRTDHFFAAFSSPINILFNVAVLYSCWKMLWGYKTSAFVIYAGLVAQIVMTCNPLSWVRLDENAINKFQHAHVLLALIVGVMFI